MTRKRFNHLKHAGSSGGIINLIAKRSHDELRAAQLADIGTYNGEDADEISASDTFKEFPTAP
jgi:hypothetical protein